MKNDHDRKSMKANGKNRECDKNNKKHDMHVKPMKSITIDAKRLHQDLGSSWIPNVDGPMLP